jgi:hypothetical protein
VIRKESWKPSNIVSPDEEEEEAYEQLTGEKGGNEVVREVCISPKVDHKGLERHMGLMRSLEM